MMERPLELPLGAMPSRTIALDSARLVIIQIVNRGVLDHAF